MHFSTPLTVLALATTALGLTGEATFYGGNLAGGACSFSTYTLPAGVFGTALSDSNWDNSAHCGACVSIRGPNGNSITAMIVDECPGCGTNALDLFPDAFAALSDPVVGRIQTTWDYVDCPISSPLEVHNKDGVSANWFSTQVVNAKKEVSKLEVSVDGGQTWIGTERQSYNFFEKSSGFGQDVVSVKVTSTDGEEVIVAPVTCSPDIVVKADSNFVAAAAPAQSSDTAVPTVGTSIPFNEVGPGSEPTSTAAPAVSSPGTAAPVVEVGPGSESALSSASPAVVTPTPTPAAKPAANFIQAPSPSETPVSSAPPAADLNAAPSAFVKKPAPSASSEATTTRSSTTTVRETVTIHSSKSKVLPPKAKPTKTVAAFLTASSGAAPEATTLTIYDCGASSSSVAAAASSTLSIAVQPTPKSPTVTSTVPFTGAGSSVLPSSSALLLSVFAVLAALMI